LAIKARAEYFVMPQLQPLTVRPLDWSSLNDGGYYVHVHNAINVDPITAWKRKYRTRFREAPPKQALEAINHLQGTAYVVNEDVRRMMSRLLRGRSRTTLVVPEDLSAAEETPIDTSDEVDASDEDDNQLAKLAHVVAKNLTQARLFAARGQPFYYTWKMDFRGRAYPIARTLGPQGHDSAHAILKFADERPLTADGEKWLALHGFNVLGAKIKEDTLARRLEWIEDHGRQIEDAASLEPSTLEFWSGSTGDMAKFRKTAWRALAFCDAWKKCRSGERATGLPVAIDGTCNAIQHLAALTGDEKMAFETNMTGETRRQDIYGEVAEELRRKLQDDRNSEDYARFAAMMTELGVTDPLSVINRSLCKQPVMTKPYGASSEASWKAINAEFSARYGGKGSKLEGIGERFKVSGYLVRKLSESVEIILKPATGLMGWLQTAAVRIAELNVPVAWRTPLGLEVEQSYAVYTGESIQTPLKRFNMGRNSSDLTMQIPTDALDRDKTKSAIVANFVHSLDATHMMMTTLAAKRAGITSLRLVHDSFGVHANDMEVFSKLVREEFVNLYRRHDPVQEFKDYCDAILIKNGKSPLDAPPPRGKFDVTHVLQAAYFFS
jgi:DNA-directed RNA polymerase